MLLYKQVLRWYLWQACQDHPRQEPDQQESMSHSCLASTTSAHEHLSPCSRTLLFIIKACQASHAQGFVSCSLALTCIQWPNHQCIEHVSPCIERYWVMLKAYQASSHALPVVSGSLALTCMPSHSAQMDHNAQLGYVEMHGSSN